MPALCHAFLSQWPEHLFYSGSGQLMNVATLLLFFLFKNTLRTRFSDCRDQISSLKLSISNDLLAPIGLRIFTGINFLTLFCLSFFWLELNQVYIFLLISFYRSFRKNLFVKVMHIHNFSNVITKPLIYLYINIDIYVYVIKFNICSV